MRQEVADATLDEVIGMIRRGELTLDEIDEVIPIIEAATATMAAATGTAVYRGPKRSKKRRKR